MATEWTCPECEADNYLCNCEKRKYEAMRKSLVELDSVLRDEIFLLKIALHDAIKKPAGVVPESAERFYDAWVFYGEYDGMKGAGK